MRMGTICVPILVAMMLYFTIFAIMKSNENNVQCSMLNTQNSMQNKKTGKKFVSFNQNQ